MSDFNKKQDIKEDKGGIENSTIVNTETTNTAADLKQSTDANTPSESTDDTKIKDEVTVEPVQHKGIFSSIDSDKVKHILIYIAMIAIGGILGAVSVYLWRPPVVFNHYSFNLNDVAYEVLKDKTVVFDTDSLNQQILYALKSNTDKNGKSVVNREILMPTDGSFIVRTNKDKPYLYAEYNEKDNLYNIYCNIDVLKYPDYGIEFNFKPAIIEIPEEKKLNNVVIVEEQISASDKNKELAIIEEKQEKEEEKALIEADRGERIQEAASINKALYVTDDKIKGSLGIKFEGENGTGTMELTGLTDNSFIFYQYGVAPEDFTVTYPTEATLKNGERITIIVNIVNEEVLNKLPLDPEAKLCYEVKVSGLTQKEEETEAVEDEKEKDNKKSDTSSTHYYN